MYLTTWSLDPFTRWLATLSFLLCLSGCCGCSESGLNKPDGIEVSGRVLLPNRSPLTEGMLLFRPENGIFGATAQIRSDGTFTLQDSGDSKIAPGEYQVFVRLTESSTPAIKIAVNPRYLQNSEDGDSDIMVSLRESTESLVLQLKR
jgi:hypothetical protein